MKTKLFALLLIYFSIFHPRNGYSHADENSGMAIVKASPDHGFKLSEAAWKRLKIQVTSLKTVAPFTIPSSSLVHYQDRVGIYRLRNGWFQLVPIYILKQTMENLQIDSKELQEGDAIVTQGIGFLRVADMEVFGEAAGGHIH